jgi:lysozyme
VSRDPISEAPPQYWGGVRAKAIDLVPSTVAIAQIERLEGLRLEAYEDVGGVRTIGYGHTFGVTPHEVIDEYEAEQLLIADLNRTKLNTDAAITVMLMQHEYDALMSFAYNIGATKFARSDVLRHVNSGNIEKAGQAMLTWSHVNHKLVWGLLQRRKLERRWLTANPLI